MAVQDYPGAAEELALSSGINDSVNTFTVSTTPSGGWPTGSGGPFVAVIDPGTVSEEKVLIASRSGTTFSSVTRGYDGTSESEHANGAKVQATVDAQSFKRANKAVVQTIEKATTAGQILVASGSEAFNALDKGANNTVLRVSGAGAVGYGKVTDDETDATVASAASVTSVADDLSTHEAATTTVHGITDTADLETTTGAQDKVDTHAAVTTSVHGIDDTADLVDSTELATAVAGVLTTENLLHVRHETTSASGTFSSGAWRTRALNTVKTNTITGASLSSNQFTLPAGTYWIEAEAPATRVNRHQAKIRNTTDSTDDLVGTSASASNDTNRDQTPALVRGVLTIAAEKTFELQHQCETTWADFGFGVNTFTNPNVFAEVRIWKVG